MSTKIYYYKNPKTSNYKTLDSLGSLKNHIRAKGKSQGKSQYSHFELLKMPEYQKIINSKEPHASRDIRAAAFNLNCIINELSPIYEHDVSTHETVVIKLKIETDNKTWKEEYGSIYTF